MIAKRKQYPEYIIMQKDYTNLTQEQNVYLSIIANAKKTPLLNIHQLITIFIPTHMVLDLFSY